MSALFTKKTFQFFEGARKNRKNEAWFSKNKALYLEAVRDPLIHLMTVIQQEFRSELPGIRIKPTRVSQPLYRANRVPDDGTIIKQNAHVGFGEKELSRFEWNPRFYFAVGDENLMAIGLYMVSGRQIKILRETLAEDPSGARKQLENKKMVRHWGELQGEKYKKFPRGFEEKGAAAKYLYFKQFYFAKEFSKSKLCSKSLIDETLADLHAAMPFYSWLRKTVGVYSSQDRVRDLEEAEE